MVNICTVGDFQDILDGYSYDEFNPANLFDEMQDVLDKADHAKAELDWMRSNERKATNALKDWYEDGIRAAKDEEAYNRSWDQELAREAGNMYGMQGYHDYVGLNTEYDRDECQYCGGNGGNCC